MNRALSRVLTGTPSSLARELVQDVCKHQMSCDCCPGIIAALWKRQLPGNVVAGIAHCEFTKANFNQVMQLADVIFASQPNSVAALSVAAVTTTNPADETLPAIPYPVGQVAAIRGCGGRGRGSRGRGKGSGGQQPAAPAPGGA